MHHDNDTHPVPAWEVQRLPCGCSSMRCPAASGGWVYVVYADPACWFDGRRIGTGSLRRLFVHRDASMDDIHQALERLGLPELADPKPFLDTGN